MVNYTLFASAIVCTAFHVAGIQAADPNPTYAAFLLTACATSLWNHGTTSRTAQLADRAIMVIGVPITAILHPHPEAWMTLAALSVSYGIAKATNTLLPHIAAHLLITALNLRILGVY